MKQIKFLKAPGYIFDLLYLFIFHFNKTNCLNTDINENKTELDIAFYNQMLQEFSPIPDELEIFFHMKKNGEAFLTSLYFKPYEKHFSSDYNFDYLQKELSDHNRIVDNLITYYFPALSNSEAIKVRNSMIELSVLIDQSEYDELIKRKLYSFFINPQPSIHKLIYELMAKDVLLTKYYEKNYQQIFDAQNGITFDKLEEELKCFRDVGFLRTEDKDVYVSICLLNKNCLNLFLAPADVTILLGFDYQDALLFHYFRNQLPDLKSFGDVITEQNRIDILNLLLEREEITIKDLERVLDLTGSTAYYHITMMTRFNIVKTRNQGRTVLYSLNEQYFESIIEILSKYLKRG